MAMIAATSMPIPVPVFMTRISLLLRESFPPAAPLTLLQVKVCTKSEFVLLKRRNGARLDSDPVNERGKREAKFLCV